MRPRLALLLGALLAAALPLLTAGPAHAAIGTICVGPVPAGTVCNTTRTTIPLAIAEATSGDLIRVGSGSYNDGPYVLPAGVSLRGSGAGTGAAATKLTLVPGAQTYLTANQGSVSDLRVEMTTGNGATGIAASNSAVVNNVVVFGAGSTGSTGLQVQGSQVHDVTVNVTGGSGNTAVKGMGGNSFLSESTWNGGAVGYRQVAGSDTVARVTVTLADVAVSVDAGSLAIDDSVLDLGSAGVAGLRVHPNGGAASADASANHLTVVGGAAASRGVTSDASGAGTLTATVTLRNSIVRGPATSVAVDPGSAGSTASLAVDHSAYQTTQGTISPDGTNLVGVDPSFIDPTGNVGLRANSPMVDKGVATPASLDRAGNGRLFDGDRNGVPVPDMGAYELRDVTAPTTVVTAGPSGPTKDNTPVFTFRSGADAVFECQIDASSFQACSSPVTTTPLPDGPHTFTVRAHDEVFNIEANPPKKTFTVDTLAPDTTLTKKPQKRFFKQKVKFKFSSNGSGAKFQCQLDNLPWRNCSSPFRYNVKIGKHRLLVRALDAAGNVDPTPARYKFNRVKRHR